MRDELHLCMRNGHAFTGFHEGTICFPPSYRLVWGMDYPDGPPLARTTYSKGWLTPYSTNPNTPTPRWFRVPTPDGVGDLAADYLDAQRLLDMVYTTWVKRKGSVAERAMNRIRSISRGASAVSAAPPHPASMTPSPSPSPIPTTDAEADQSGGDCDGQGGSAHPNRSSPVLSTHPLLGKLWSRRTPSYTDRIVFFSLPGMEGRLSSLAYEMADFVGAFSPDSVWGLCVDACLVHGGGANRRPACVLTPSAYPNGPQSRTPRRRLGPPPRRHGDGPCRGPDGDPRLPC